MPTHTMVPSKKSLAEYAELRRRVRETIAAGKERALDAVERERVRTAWEVGRLIQGHILLHKERAEYGTQVLKRLSADLAMSDTELYYRVEFARAYPIFRSTGKLPWGHYQALLRINDADQRKKLTDQASRQNWHQDKLRHEIRKLKAARQITVLEAPADELLIPIKGELDTYRIVTGEAGPWKGRPLIDTGFSKYEELDPLQAGPFDTSATGRKYKEGDIVQLKKGTLAPAPGLTGVDLYTYRAYLVSITASLKPATRNACKKGLHTKTVWGIIPPP